MCVPTLIVTVGTSRYTSSTATSLLFFDRGGYKGLVFKVLSKLDNVHFYTPAIRYPTNVEQLEALTEEDFEPDPFVFDKHTDLPREEQPSFCLADITMEISVWEDKRLTGTVELAIEYRSVGEKLTYTALHNVSGPLPYKTPVW